MNSGQFIEMQRGDFIESQTHRQPCERIKHLSAMKLTGISPVCLGLLVSCLCAFVACSSNQDNPDEIRRRTAEATETMRRDTKAVVEGVKEGMGHDSKAVDINKASREDLLTLPGMTERNADRLIAERPYGDAHDLVKRHVVSEAEYIKIQDRIIAGR
jgi:hypothetical protein